VLKVLGQGGMGVVFLAQDTRLGRQVALKAMLPHLAAKADAHERFLREARTAAAIEHDNIVAILQVDEDRGVPYIAMPLLRGTTLESWLREHADEMLDVPLILKLGKQIAMGLAAAHTAGLIHRDIKPANIFLQATAIDPTGRCALLPSSPLVVDFRAKLLDFGLARSSAGDQNLTQSGAILGTPAYMAPEQARRGIKVTHRADLFSLGVVLYRLCTGRVPFQGDDMMSTLMATAMEEPAPPRDLNPALPPRLSKLVMRLLAKHADQRPESAAEVVERLEAIEARLTDAVPVASLARTPAPPSAEPVPEATEVVSAVARPAAGLVARGDATPQAVTLWARLLYRPVFALTMFIASGLLFLLQPMVAKVLTPQLGGTPAVWSTCLVFFQLVVLAGYLYVFLLHVVRGTRIQSLLHLGVFGAAILFAAGLWHMLARGAGTNLETRVIAPVFGLLVVSAGLPVLVLAATAPLLQRWLAETPLPERSDPYSLFAAGSLGGLAALAMYPVVIEPTFALSEQFTLWAWGFGGLAVLVVVCLIILLIQPRRTSTPAAATEAASPAVAADAPIEPTWTTPVRWLVCAALPSSLLIGFTANLTEDISPAPLFWTVPLALFMFAVVLGFGRSRLWGRLPLAARIWIQCGHGLTIALVLGVTLMLASIDPPSAWVPGALLAALVLLIPYRWIWVLQPVAIVVFFIQLGDPGFLASRPVMLVSQLFCLFLTLRICQRELARSRPTTPYLTRYYVWMGLGGILGGVFNLLIAPLIFRTSQLEYPLVLLLASAIRPPYLRNGLTDWLASFAIPRSVRARVAPHLARAFDLTLPVLLGLVLWLIFGAGTSVVTGMPRAGRPFGQPDRAILATQAVYGLAMLLCVVVVARPLRFALCLVFALVFHVVYGAAAGRDRETVYVDRTLFGTLKVQKEVTRPEFRPGQPQGAPQNPEIPLDQLVLLHGTTHHGMNFMAPTHRRLATTYYHRSGPLGTVLERYNWSPGPSNTYHADARGAAALLGMLAQPALLPPAAIAATAFAEPPIAVLGLGTGTVASYARPFQRVDFFELSPAVIRLCEPRPDLRALYFHYVNDARLRGAQVKLFAGDARLSLAEHGPDAFYKVIVVDAFSSDAIPVHLLTKEAIALYLAKLAPGGIIAMHISNRHVELAPVLATTAQSLGIAWLRANCVDTTKAPVGMFSSEWFFLTRHPADLAPPPPMPRDVQIEWQRNPPARQRVWTDDYTSLQSVFRERSFINIFTSVLLALIGLMVLLGLATLVLDVLDILLPRSTRGGQR
jgi:tRNA A-37 threonylcarbamoyl transferase component Bud32